jgi:FkbM family methyltransferase
MLRAVRLLRRLAANLLLSPAAGTVVSVILRNRIPFFGMWVDTSAPAISSEVKASLLFGRYERVEVDQILAHIPRDVDVVELGGGLGVTTALLLRHLRAPARLITLEFRPELWATIQRTVEENADASRWTLVKAAVGYRHEGVQTFSLPIGAFGSRASYAHRLGERYVTAPTVQLGSILEKFSITDYSLVSDIEGNEVDIMRLDAEALKRCRNMVIELHDAEFNGAHLLPTDLLCELKEQHGFSVAAASRVGNVYALHKPVAFSVPEGTVLGTLTSQIR